MSAYGGLGPMTNGVLWMMVIITAVFVALRLYTRHQILNAVGVDDYLCFLALILHIIYTIFVSIASHYGLGRLNADVGDMATYFEAAKYELFSQVAGITLIGVGKMTVGVFLLRIVRNKIQIWIIRLCLVITVLITTFASACVIVQCIPVQKSWNPMIKGHCWIDFSKVGYSVGSWFVAADFSFAILPWFVIWDLNMKRKEKITIACGLSLGVFAGVCGIVRTVALSGLNAQEYIYDTVPMLIWSATESCVTIMCSSIPILRPLYVQVRYGKDGKSGNSGGSSDNPSYKLPLYANNRKYGILSKPSRGLSGLDTSDLSYARTVVNPEPSNKSDENILVHDVAGIERTDEISVSYEQCAKRF